MAIKLPPSQHRFIFILAIIVVFILAIATITINFRRIDNQTTAPTSLFDNIITKFKNSINKEPVIINTNYAE